jgi:hypothetical protein
LDVSRSPILLEEFSFKVYFLLTNTNMPVILFTGFNNADILPVTRDNRSVNSVILLPVIRNRLQRRESMMLDTEKIRWMLHRNDGRFWGEDELEIYQKLSKDRYETMHLLETCTTEELELLEWNILDFLTVFEKNGGYEEYIAFLEELGERKSDSLQESVKQYKEERKLEQMDDDYISGR